MEAMKFGLPEGIKDCGDTAFELARGINIYGYLYKTKLVTKERMRESADNYDRAMNILSRVTHCLAKRVHCVPLGQV